jgi:broad specificity phosphatase PhoE
MKIYAMRHGQTTDNYGTIHGNSDFPLSAAGLEQVQEAAKGLIGKDIIQIYASPSNPATETAEVIDKYLDGRNKWKADQRLRERDFGEFEYKKITDVDMESLCRYTDSTPIRDGETVRDVVVRVFDFLDETIWRYDYEAVLLVVSEHVLRTIQWYFNGLPEAGNETVNEVEHCRCYEFDTDSIPEQIIDYQITWDKQRLKERLSNLCRSNYEPNYTTCFAMCYKTVTYGDAVEPYTCVTCGSVTEHRAEYLRKLERVKKYPVGDMMDGRVKVDMAFDESEYCSHCSGKIIPHPKPVLSIRFSPDDEYHAVRTDNFSDYQCLLAFIKNYDEYEGGARGYAIGRICHYPLSAHVDQIVKMTGLSSIDAVRWKGWAEKEIARRIVLIKEGGE